VPALLAPRNVPILKNRPGSKILIATTAADWADLQSRPVIRQLAQFVELFLIDIGLPQAGAQAAQLHSAKGHRLGCRKAYEEGAIAGWLTPDLLMSDGLIEKTMALLDAGKKIVRFPALRYVMEPIVERLKAADRWRSDGAMALPSGILSDIAVDALHPELLRYDFDGDAFDDYPLWTFWRVPARRGLILYTVSWGFVADFTAIVKYDESSFALSTIDGVFPNDNFGHLPEAEIGLVNDSHDGLFMGLTPLADLVFDSARARAVNRFYARFGLGTLKRMKDIHRLHYRAEIDGARRYLHLVPFVIHGDALDQRYQQLIRETKALMTRATQPDYRSPRLDFFDLAVRIPGQISNYVRIATHILGDLFSGKKTLKYCVRRVFEEIGLAKKGDLSKPET
jgi:hypothetical protein